jgi:hypothetical protein
MSPAMAIDIKVNGAMFWIRTEGARTDLLSETIFAPDSEVQSMIVGHVGRRCE